MLTTSYSGLKVYGLEGNGPLANASLKQRQMHVGSFIKVSNDDHENNEDEEFWEEIHEFLAKLTVLLIILHIAGVVLASKKHLQNLVRAMISGYKK